MSTYSFRVDSRLHRLSTLVQRTYCSLTSSSDKRSLRLRDLMPDGMASDEKARRLVRPILDYFGFTERGSALKLRRPPAKRLVRRWRMLHLVFWRLTSLWYPDQTDLTRTKKEIEGLLGEFGYSPDLYPGIKACMDFAGFTRGVVGSGGFRLLHPVDLAPDLLQTRDATFRFIQSAQEIQSEYDLYNPDTRPLVRFVRTIMGRSWDQNHGPWTLHCDQPGGKPVQKSAMFPDQGIWQNPDIVGLRRMNVAALGTSEVQILAVEVKLNVDIRGISEAEAFFEFANYVYIAVAAPFRDVLKHSRFLRVLVEKGIGLIVMKRAEDYTQWLEVVPASFHAQSNAVLGRAMEQFKLDKAG